MECKYDFHQNMSPIHIRHIQKIQLREYIFQEYNQSNNSNLDQNKYASDKFRMICLRNRPDIDL